MTEHSPKFDDVKQHYDFHLWKKSTVKLAVKRKWITAAEYEEITGEKYVA
jgi:uncharacterized XkdX family phage protein